MSKLQCSRGETLIETLVATLIIALSSILLLSMSVTAATINKRSDEATKLYQTELAAAEKGGGTRDATITIKVKGGETHTYNIVFSSDDKKKLNSYTKEVAP